MRKALSVLLALLITVGLSPAAFAVDADRADFCLNIFADKINTARGNTEIIVYDSSFGSTTGTSGTGTEIVVDANGSVAKVTFSRDNEIPQGGFVISAGAAAQRHISGIKTGDLVRFNADNMQITAISKDFDLLKQTALSYTAINATRTENTLIIYRGGAYTNTNTWGYEVTVDADGIIVSLGGNNSAIPDGGFVLSAIGDKKQPLTDAAKLGMSVTIDTDTKTVAIGYQAEKITSKYALDIAEIENISEENKLNLYTADLTSAELSERFGELQSLSESIGLAVNSGDYLTYSANDFLFDRLSRETKDKLIPYSPVESRTLWLRIPTNNSLSTVQKTVAEIASLGFNSVCIEAMFDNTMILPMPDGSLFEQNPAFNGVDMLKLYIDELHKFDIEVHLWMSVYRVGYEGSSNTSRSVGSKKPEWRVVSQTGTSIVSNEFGDAYFLNPALPEVKQLLLDTYKYILENYDIDGFQLDYVRYPESAGQVYGYDEVTTSAFLANTTYTTVPASSSQAGWREWAEHRAGYVTDFVSSLGGLIKELRPDVWLSADVAPASLGGISDTMCQDAVGWIENGLIDIVYPMAYGTTDAVTSWTEQTLALAGDKVYSVMGLRDNGASDYRNQITVCRKLGADGSAFFSYSQYIAGDYSGYIEKNVFSHPAVNPTANAKNAVIAQLEHTSARLSDLDATLSISSLSYDVELRSIDDIRKDIDAVVEVLNNSTVTQSAGELKNLADKLSGFKPSASAEKSKYYPGVAELLNKTAHVVNLAVNNSKDDAKTAYLAAHPRPVANDSSDASGDTSGDDSSTDIGVVDRIFQVLFIIIMTTGLLGLPLYLYLEKRRKRLAAEYNERESEDDDSEQADDTEENENQD